MPHWEHFFHTADIGVRGIGPSLHEAFEQTALALTALVTDPHTVTPQKRVDVECDAPELDILLFDWLNAIISAMTTERMLFSVFSVSITPPHLTAHLWGEAMDPLLHTIGVEPKAATFNGLKVERNANSEWQCECIVDV